METREVERVITVWESRRENKRNYQGVDARGVGSLIRGRNDVEKERDSQRGYTGSCATENELMYQLKTGERETVRKSRREDMDANKDQ